MPYNIGRSAFAGKTVLLVGGSKKIHLYIPTLVEREADRAPVDLARETARRLLLRSLAISFDSLAPSGIILLFLFFSFF